MSAATAGDAVRDLERAAWLLQHRYGMTLRDDVQLIPWNHHLATRDDIEHLPARLKAVAASLRAPASPAEGAA